MEENNNSTSRNTNPTPQEQYQKEQLEKANFNPLDVSHSSTEDAYRRRKNKERHAQIEAWLAIAGLGGGAYGTAILVNKNPELAEFIAKLPGANRYSIKHEIAVDNSIAFGGKPTNLKGLYADQSLGRSLLSIAASIEELSPFGVLKTLQFTNILEPLTNVSREAKDVHISGSTIRSSLDYYDRLIHTMSGKEKSLLESDTRRGFLLRNNQLFRYLEDGTIDEADPVLKHVRMVTTHTKMGEEISPNRLLNKFANLLGTNLGYDSYSREGTALIAGKSWKDLAMRWANAGFMHSMEIGYKTLDNPLQGVEELFKATGIPNIGKNGSLVGGIFDSNWYQSLKKKANIQLGTGGVYNTTTTDAMTRLGKNLVGKSLAAYVGYQAVNQVLDMVTPDSSAWNDGIISGLTANYANVRVGLAKVLADPFQRYKEAQENVADGSTSLITLAGFPIAGATAGASLAWYKRMKDSAFEGIEAATLDSDIKVHKYGFAQGIAEKLKLGETNLSKSWGFRGAVIGAAISLPFLPGALIGESSEDLKASYSGERKEAYRVSTGWLAGSEDIKGGHIKAFVPSRVARILSNAEDEVRYDGDNKLKRQLDPIYSPLNYLKNPYAFEEMHQDDMPYPVWGMNVDYGSFLGKIYQGTVGEFIKPTIINPQFLEDSRLIRTNAIENYRQQAQLDVNRNEQQSASQTYHASKLSLAANWLGITGKSGEYPIMSFAKPNERQMIDSGMMLAEESPSSDPHTLAAAQTYNALTDFTGLKGFTTSLIVNKMGYDPTDVRRQLARSGDAVSLADDFKDANVGDALGCFTPEMRVKTIDGYKEIQCIRIGDLVLTKDNSYKPVWNIFPKYIEDVILNIKVSGIKNIIRVTKNHIVPAYIDGVLVEVNAGDLKQNDILIIPDGHNNYIYSEIEYIYESIYDGYVFDLGVEDIHYYTVENVLVHNSGEFLRRIIPMGAGSSPDDVNPMLNNSANWLPNDPTKYFNDFSRGNSFCLAPDSLVEVYPNKVKKAKDILETDLLVDKKGYPTKIQGIVKLKDKETLKIIFNLNGTTPITCTGEHPIAVKIKSTGTHKPMLLGTLKVLNKFLKALEGKTEVKKEEIALKVGKSASGCTKFWKLLEKYGKIKTTKKRVYVLDTELFDEYLLDYGIYFKEAKDLEVGDYVAYPKPIYNNSSVIDTFDLAEIFKDDGFAITENYIYYNRSQISAENYEYFRGESEKIPDSFIYKAKWEQLTCLKDTPYRFKRYLKLSSELGSFAGLWLAEGWSTGTAHHVKEIEVVNKIYNDIGIPYKIRYKEGNGCYASFHCKWLARFMGYICGYGAKNKFIHDVVFNAPQEFVDNFIKMYYFGDGSEGVYDRRHVKAAKTVSYQLALNMQKLLLIRQGIIASVVRDAEPSKKSKINEKEIKSGISYNIYIRPQESHSNLWRQDEKYIYWRVNSIEYSGSSDVYAFETEDSTFCAYNILTHNSKIPLGEHRLPGKGLEAYRPELKGMDPNDYPLIYQYQVLSDVATNSPEHLSLKTYLLNADKEGKLSDTERDMFYESLTEEQAKKQRKQFSEYKSAEQFSKFSLGGKVLNTIWETAAHKAESPLETLTPFRPGAKFIHKRSAIEDYEMTMLNGPDTGIWTNPYSHFIRPAINRTAGILPGTQKPEHAEERDNVEEYFDKLEYLKARRNGRTNDVLRTVHGATAAGILDVNDFNKFSAGLSDNQRDYLQSFSKTTDSSDRRKILEMLPTDVAAGYQRIWNNLEVAEKAKKSGKDVDEAVKDAYIKSNMKELLSSRITGSNDSAQLDAAVMESKKQKAMSGQNFSRRDELLAKTRELKLREADKEAEAYVAARTGVPGEDWIGWDPRLKLDEVKLRTLQIGKADTYDYGFWDSDLKRNARIIALDDEDEVTRSYEDIKRTMRSDLLRKKDIERTMFNNGIFARRVVLSDANTNNTDIRLQE